MLLLIAIPVFVAVAAFQRYLGTYAPTNILIRRVGFSPARFRTATRLAALAVVLLLAMRGVQVCVSAGRPAWLNLVALVLAWDAIKIGCSAIGVALRSLVGRTDRQSARIDAHTASGLVGSSRV